MTSTHEMTWQETDQCALLVVNATFCKVSVSCTYTYTCICILSPRCKMYFFQYFNSQKSLKNTTLKLYQLDFKPAHFSAYHVTKSLLACLLTTCQRACTQWPTLKNPVLKPFGDSCCFGNQIQASYYSHRLNHGLKSACLPRSCTTFQSCCLRHVQLFPSQSICGYHPLEYEVELDFSQCCDLTY